jgi:hypothetical protein
MRRLAALIAVFLAGCAGWDKRPLVPADPPLAAADLAVVDPPVREPVGTLSPRKLHRDLEVLVFALGAYDPRAWRERNILPDDLMRLAARPLTVAELCPLLVERMQTRRRQPRLVVSRATGERCEPRPYFRGEASGRQFPAGGGPFALETRSTKAGPVAVLAVNRFDARDRDAWRELPRALATVESDGLIVDLRQVRGTDPTGGMLLARLLGGRDDVSPVLAVRGATSDVAETLRANHRRRRGGDDATPPPWAAPVDKTPVGAIRVPRELRFIVDSGCREACVVTALALERRARTRRIGELWLGWAEGARPGLVVLPHSGILVEIPTMSVDLEDTPVLGTDSSTSADLLEGGLEVMERILAIRARLDRWRDHDPPPLCANPERLPAEQVPPATQIKIGSFGSISELPAGAHIGVFIKLTAGLEQAMRLLKACPGVDVFPGVQTVDGETITTMRATKEVLFRLADNDIVVRIETGPRLRPE